MYLFISARKVEVRINEKQDKQLPNEITSESEN